MKITIRVLTPDNNKQIMQLTLGRKRWHYFLPDFQTFPHGSFIIQHNFMGFFCQQCNNWLTMSCLSPKKNWQCHALHLRSYLEIINRLSSHVGNSGSGTRKKHLQKKMSPLQAGNFLKGFVYFKRFCPF